MERTAYSAFDQIFAGVNKVRFVDFPDHRNVGDSAIALGQLAYFKARCIGVESIHCIGTFDERLLDSKFPLVINGGGNIAGFFDGIDAHRNKIAKSLAADTLLIQAPQSIHFNNAAARSKFKVDFAGRKKIRIAVRDSEAISSLSDIYDSPILAPDAVHLLGHIKSAEPELEYVVLKRQDRESATSAQVGSSFDWPSDRGLTAAAASLRWKTKYSGPFKPAFNPSPRRWEQIANKRFAGGIDMLSKGNTVVTDRLHAMLLSLQMGRRVIAVDNNNKKLSKYAQTWFEGTDARVEFASNFEGALKLV